MICPEEQDFADLVEGRLPPSSLAALHEHASACRGCQQLLAALARASSPEPTSSDQIAHYRLDGVLGRGGMGVVHRAFDLKLRRAVAIKILTPGLAADPQARARLEREARASAALDHRHVGGVHEIGEHEGRVFLVMPLFEGGTIKDRLAAGREPLALPEAVTILRQLVAALAAAHQLGVVHRDVKPGNVMLTQSGVRLVDFGLAKLHDASLSLSTTGQLLGTPAYMAPEQFAGVSDARTDVWGAAAVGYELLAGRPPFDAVTFEALHLAVVTHDPEPIGRADVPHDLETILLKGLEKDPARRYPSAVELAQDLERFAEAQPIVARRTALATRAWRGLRRHATLAAGALVLLVIAASATAFTWSRRDAGIRLERTARLAEAAARMRSRIRNAYLLPLHDTTPDRQAVRAELDQIEAERRRLGPDERGQDELALGVGELALADYAAARPHLEAAWRADQRGSELAYSLALDLAYLYGERRGDTERLLPTERATVEHRLAVEFRDPARQYLRAAAGGGPPGAVEALIAVYEDRQDDAIRLTREVFERSPSDYEFGELYATALMYRAMSAWQHGDAKTPAQFDELEAVLTRVLAVARSDPREHANAAHAVTRMATFRMMAGASGAHEGYLRAIKLAEEAEQIAPQEASAFEVHVDALVGLGLDSGDLSWLRRAVEVAERAVALAPQTWRALFARGTALAELASTQSEQGHDSRQEATRAIVDLRASLKLHDYEDTYHQLAIAQWTLALLQARSGQDPRAVYDEGAATLRRTIAIDASNADTFGDLSHLLRERAEWELEHGIDPGASLNDALAMAEKARPAAQRDSYPLLNAGWALLVCARYQLAMGHPAAPTLTRVDQVVAACEPLHIADSGCATVAAEAWRLRAVMARRAGENARPALVQARAQVARELGDKDNDPRPRRVMARIELLAAELGLGGPERARLDQARLQLERLSQHDPLDGDGRALMAQVRVRERGLDCAAVDAMLTAALAHDPRSARLHWVHAQLDEACARATPPRAAALTAAAAVERKAALALEPYLATDPN